MAQKLNISVDDMTWTVLSDPDQPGMSKIEIVFQPVKRDAAHELYNLPNSTLEDLGVVSLSATPIATPAPAPKGWSVEYVAIAAAAIVVLVAVAVFCGLREKGKRCSCCCEDDKDDSAELSAINNIYSEDLAKYRSIK